MNDVVWEETPNICEQQGLEPVRNQGLQHPRLETCISSSTTQVSQVFSSLLLPRGLRVKISPDLPQKLAPLPPILQTPLLSHLPPVFFSGVLLFWSWGHIASFATPQALLLREVISGEKLYIAED